MQCEVGAPVKSLRGSKGAEAVEPGSSCEVECAAPYEGASTIATCLADNVDPTRQAGLEAGW